MPPTTPTALKRLHTVALLDGIALLSLVCIGVPLKRLMDFPWLVKLLGPLHGILFISLIILVIHNLGQQLISKRLGLMMIVLSFTPFGAFYADARLKQHIRTTTTNQQDAP